MVRMKKRITVSVEPDALQIAQQEVRAGTAPNVSVAVEEALKARGRKQALREAVELWEAEFGPIDQEASKWAEREWERVLQKMWSSTPEH